MRPHPQFIEQQKGRIRTGTPHAKNYLETIDNIVGVCDRFAQERLKVDADKTLSPEGKSDAIAVVAQKMARDLADVSRPVRLGLQMMEVRRAKFTVGEVDRKDIVGELKRAEIRAFVSDLPAGRRPAAALELAKSREGVMAILDAPAMLSGLSPKCMG